MDVTVSTIVAIITGVAGLGMFAVFCIAVADARPGYSGRRDSSSAITLICAIGLSAASAVFAVSAIPTVTN